MARPDNDIAPASPDRYTLDGDAAVEARIERDQNTIVDGVRKVLVAPEFKALVLMGGYGRGEGGFVMRDDGPNAYNDYDYFVVVSELERARRRAIVEGLAAQAQDLEHEVGVEVDFALLPAASLAGAEYSLMNAEMIWGHRVVDGDTDALSTMPPMPFSTLPLGEFTRLMLNRGALLLMNRQRLADGGDVGPQAREIHFKYLFKAILACGDARLAGNHSYDPSYVRKLELLRAMDWDGSREFLDLYAQALEHKFHPAYQHYMQEDARAWQGRVVRIWLQTLAWLEPARSGWPITDWARYCSPQYPKGQERRVWRGQWQAGLRESWGGLRYAAITARDFGLGELIRRPGWSRRYPRERLISALPMLLSSDDSDPSRPTPAPVCNALAIPSGTPWLEGVGAFLRYWGRYA